MNDRNKRMSALDKMPPFARMDYRNNLNENGESRFLAGLTRIERRKAKAAGVKIGKEYLKILKDLAKSGMGFPVDQTIRQMGVEYTNRFASSGVHNMPVSFNYFEPFFEIKLINQSYAPYMKVSPEINHLFNASDFFDFLTSKFSEGFNADELLNLPDSKIVHFTNNGVIDDLTFFDASGREYVLSGFSMIRRGNSIHWLLLCGEHLSQEQWDLRQKDVHEITLENIPPWKRAFLEECIEKSGPNTGPPIKLEGTDTAVRTLILGEFDASVKKHITKSIFIETENSFSVFTDDPEVISGLKSEEDRKNIIDTCMERLGEADVLWNISEGLLQLPHYFETRITISKSLISNRSSLTSLKGKGGRGVVAEYVAVEAVSIDSTDKPPAIRRIKMPGYPTEIDGHWRRLGNNKNGKDRNGDPVAGKTWVNKSSPWRKPINTDGVIYVKDCLAVAEKRVNDLYALSKNSPVTDKNKNAGNGELYVLRCPLNMEEVYKVGWTSGTADERAKQLSSSTGVPLAFVVVESWPHDDPEALETEVHAQLSPYRTNNQREFFKLNFKEIRKVIIRTIDRIESARS